MTSWSFINQYEQFGRDWLSKEGPKWQGKDIDKATEALTATVEKRAKDHIDAVGTELLERFSVNKRTVATAGAGLIPFGKILVGAVMNVMNLTFINKVLLEFALDDQANIDKLNEDLKKICKLDKVARKVNIEALKKTAEATFKEGLNASPEEHAHFLPIIGHMYNVGTGGYRAYSACRKTILKTMILADGVHCQTFVPLALRREVESQESVISALDEICKLQPVVKCYRVPHCVRCFLGPTDGNRSVYCQSCISERPEAGIPESRDFKRCHWKNHGKQEDNENVGRLHDERWCTIRLIKAAKKKEAWECIPCFFMFGKHKPTKCILNTPEEICEFCGLKGHHAAACGKRFFNAYCFIMQAKVSDMDIGPLVADKKFVTEKRTEAFRNVQRYKSRTAGMSYGMSYLPQAMTRENTECVLLGSVMLYKSGMEGPQKLTKDEIARMTGFDYQTHVNISKSYIKPALVVGSVDEVLYD